MAGTRKERLVTTYDAQYDDRDGKLHFSRTTTTEVTTGRGREWSQGDRQYEPDVLVLTPRQFTALISTGTDALGYYASTVQAAGVRFDNDERVYGERVIPVRLAPDTQQENA